GGAQSRVTEAAREFVRAAGLPAHDRGDGSLTHARIETARAEGFLPVARVAPEIPGQVGLVLEHVEGGQTGGGDRRWMRRRKQERARAGVEKIDQVAAAANVAAQNADRFGERAHLDMDAPVQIEVVNRAAAGASEDTG